jgi:hypothetical protein
MGGSGGPVTKETTVFTGLDSQNATEGNVQHVMAVTQSFTKFMCFGPKPTSSHEDMFTVRVNGVSKAGTCTIPNGGEVVVTVPVSITIKAGELFDVQVTQGSGTGGVTWALAP